MSSMIMVALDGSEKDVWALSAAVPLASLANGSIHLVRVIPPPSPRLIAQAVTVGVDEDAVTGRREIIRWLKGLAVSLAFEAERKVTFDVLEGPDVPDELLRHVAMCDPRLIVMATRAPGPTRRAVAGSVADRVMRESPRPVVLVPPGAAPTRERRRSITRVLVPQDGSELSERSLEFLLGLPHAPELEYALVEVVSSAAERNAADKRLQAATERVRASGVKGIESVVLIASSPAAAILRAAGETAADVIAMSTRGAGGLQRFVLGSVAEGVVRESSIPVLLLTPAVLAHPDHAIAVATNRA